MCWNVEGLCSKLSEPGFLDYIKLFDVCCLTETFSSPTFDFGVYFNEYTAMHLPGIKLSSQGRRSGGVVMLAKKDLNVTRLSTGCDTIVAFKFNNPFLISTILVCAYIPPLDSPYYRDKQVSSNISLLEDTVMTFQENFPRSPILICGDMNARIGQWDIHADGTTLDGEDMDASECAGGNFSSPRATQDRTVNAFGRLLRNFCLVHHATIMNGCSAGDDSGRFTYISPHGDSVIDYGMIIAQCLPYTVDFRVASRIESHHMPLEMVLGPPKLRCEPTPKLTVISKLCWDDTKTELMKKKVYSQEFNDKLTEATASLDNSIDAAVAQISDALFWSADCMKKEIVVSDRISHKPRAPWFDVECKEARKEVYGALKKYRDSKSAEDKELYTHVRKRYKGLLREKKSRHYISVREKLMSNLQNSRTFWGIVRKSTRRPSSPANISLEDWKIHFEKMYTVPHKLNCIDTSGEELVCHDRLDERISREEVRCAINSLKPSKAPGLDGLPGGCIRIACDKLVPFLTELFNKLFDNHFFPVAWSKSILIPLHKKGDVHNPDNYRGITLLCALCKVFTNILSRRLRTWMELEEKISDEQAGFRTNYSTIDHIFTLHSIVTKHVYGDRRGKLYVAFVDYRKAFDTVNHQQLWKVLKGARLSTKFLLMLQAIYANVKSCVRWGGELSNFFCCPAGVKQGANESPSLFSLYINYVANYVRSKGKHGIQMVPGMSEIFLLMFADDVVLMSTTPIGLQNQLDSLVHVSNMLDLKINIGKTKVMIFRKGGPLSQGEKWRLDGTQLEVVNQYKYLGYVFTTKLSDRAALDDLAVRGKQKGSQVLKALWNLRSLNTKVFTSMLDAQVQSTLLYGSEIWGLKKHPEVEVTHTFVCKRFLGLDSRSPNHMVYGDLGRFPLHINSSIRSIKYWLKLCSMREDRLPKQAYRMLLFSRIKEGRNWAVNVKNCLFQFGFGYVWMNEGKINAKQFLSRLKQRMKDCFLQEWNRKNTSSDRYKWFSTIKQNHGVENFLNLLDIKKFRDVFIRFRFSINDLRCNKRYDHLLSTNCPFCGTIENEEHFLLVCPAYQQLREKYISRYVKFSWNAKTCKYLMKGTDYGVTRSTAMYIFYAMKRREQILAQ